MSKWASYIRVSTNKQDKGAESQRSSINQYIKDQGVEEWNEYVDLDESGSNDERKEFNELLEAVKQNKYDVVVMPEVSRLARKTSKAAEFIDEAVKTNTEIHLLNDMIDKIEAKDPMSQFLAKFLSIFYEQERKQTIERVKRGVKHAQESGKWVGKPPAGFKTEEGYLKVDMTEYLKVQAALERIDEGESKRSVAQKTGINRSTLTNLYKNKKHLYLNTEEDIKDEKIKEAVKEFNPKTSKGAEQKQGDQQ